MYYCCQFDNTVFLPANIGTYISNAINNLKMTAIFAVDPSRSNFSEPHRCSPHAANLKMKSFALTRIAPHELLKAAL